MDYLITKPHSAFNGRPPLMTRDEVTELLAIPELVEVDACLQLSLILEHKSGLRNFEESVYGATTAMSRVAKANISGWDGLAQHILDKGKSYAKQVDNEVQAEHIRIIRGKGSIDFVVHHEGQTFDITADYDTSNGRFALTLSSEDSYTINPSKTTGLSALTKTAPYSASDKE